LPPGGRKLAVLPFEHGNQLGAEGLQSFRRQVSGTQRSIGMKTKLILLRKNLDGDVRIDRSGIRSGRTRTNSDLA